jgi:hypothetical protein
MYIGNNRVYAPGAQVTLQCQGSMTFQQFEAQDFDAGTVLYDANALNFTTIIQVGHACLHSCLIIDRYQPLFTTSSGAATF